MEWISVKDHLPRKSQRVLVCRQLQEKQDIIHIDMATLLIENDQNIWRLWLFHTPLSHVYFWMPLPAEASMPVEILKAQKAQKD